jgi:hypothetical protein
MRKLIIGLLRIPLFFDMYSFLSSKHAYYLTCIDKNAPWVIISYITAPFYKINNQDYFLTHQNAQESIKIKELIQKKGFNILIINHSHSLGKLMNLKLRIQLSKIKNKKIQFIFGLEPNFEIVAKLYAPNSLKIYYATGSYYLHQNSSILNRTDTVNNKRNINLQYKRLVSDHLSVSISDYILQIGSSYTIQSYPPEYHEKIYLIRQSTTIKSHIDFKFKSENINKTNFLWFGSYGSILKGVDLLIDFFKKREDINLDIVGNLDTDFLQAFENDIFLSNNINYLGYMNVNSREFIEVLEKNTFIIYPSASEGGTPGSVLNAMKNGLVPILSRYSAFDGINDLGFIINELNLESIEYVVNHVLELDNEDISKLIKKNIDYVINNHSLDSFQIDIKHFFDKVIPNNF